MGISTNAILAFGFDLGEELPESLVGEDGDSGSFEFDDWVQEKAGAVYPEGHAGIESPEYVAYSEKAKAALRACPVDLVTHCSYDYPMYFFALRDSKKTAYSGSPKEISLPEVSAEEIERMKAFCVESGIEWQEPKWHIFSLWG